MTRTQGTLLLARSLFSNSLVQTYEWLNYARPFVAPDSGDIMVQGLWDQYPETPPAVRQLQRILDHAPPQPGHRLLDVGCGLGGLTGYCLQNYPEIERIAGLDVNRSHVEHAARTYAGNAQALFFHEDAAELTRVADPDLAELVTRKFHRIYMIEITPDLTRTSFESIFDQCFQALAAGGTLSLFTLTIEQPFRSRTEQFVMELLVRPGAPDLQQILSVIERHDCLVERHDVTDECTLRLAERLVETPAIVKRMLVWPVSAWFLSCVRTGIRFVQRGGYSCHVIHVRKPGC